MTVHELKEALKNCPDDHHVKVLDSNGFEDSQDILAVRRIDQNTLYGKEEDDSDAIGNVVYLDVCN
jgi:hypothetical protein